MNTDNLVQNIEDIYSSSTHRKTLVIIGIITADIALALVSLRLGALPITVRKIASVIIFKIFPFLNDNSLTLFERVAVIDIRLPRIIMAIVCGIGFAATGTAMQGVLRNPLVSSMTLGLTQAAGFGAALAIVLDLGLIGGRYLITANSFLLCLVCLGFIYGIVRLRGASPETVILAGIAIGFLFSAMLSFMEYIASEEQIKELVFWLMGGIYIASWPILAFITPVISISTVVLWRHSWNLNIMSAGEEVARSLGINTEQVTRMCMVLSALITATIISFTGIIGFICLVAPHIARMTIGADHRFLFPASCAVGALLLLGADTISRTLIFPAEIPVGITTSLIGIPFFLYLIIRRRRLQWQ